MKIVPRNPKYRKSKWDKWLVGMDLVSVVPMEMPIAIFHYLDIVYGAKEQMYNTLGIPEDKVRK